MLTLAQRRAVARYRRLVQNLAVLSLGTAKPAFHPFVSILREDEDDKGRRDWSVDNWTYCLRHEDCKDSVVSTIRGMAKSFETVRTIAVWFAVPGWASPDDETRPSRHPERRRVLLVIESTLDGDTAYERFDDGRNRWISAGSGTGRFEDLIGREKHVGHLRVVPAKKES